MVRKTRKFRGGGSSLPVTTWGNWSAYPGALAWSANSSAPAPLANGGLYTGPQSTGPWASQPFPATQYAMSMEAARVSGNPEVFYHQRPADNTGASFSPFVGVPISPQHVGAMIPPHRGGSRRRRRRGHKSRRLK